MKYLALFFIIVTTLSSAPILPDISPEMRAKSELLDNAAKKLLKANAELTDNQKKYDVIWYGLDLDIDPVSKTIAGSVTMTAQVLEEIECVELNFLEGLTVDSVIVEHVGVSFEKIDRILKINMDNIAPAGEMLTVQTFYHGTPLSSYLGGFSFDTHAGSPMIWTLSEPYAARSWWPCKDAPADKADSVDIQITVPKGLIVASNGVLADSTTAGDKTTFLWKERYPIVTYLVSLAIHPYHFYQDEYISAGNDTMPVEFYVFPDHVNHVKSTYALTVPMIETLANLYGEYPFIKEKYGHAEFKWGGGMEHQTLTSLGGWGEGLIVHELAHQWWGDMVTCNSFHHIWLNEGFATYTEALWWEHRYGAEGLHADMSRKAYKGAGTIYIEDPLNDNIFTYNLTYAKAAWVLHMLRHVTGDDVFWQIVKNYYQEYKYKTATTEQFRQVCENISGLNLQDFFQQWIYGSGYPQYQYYYHTQAINNTYQTSLEIKQLQSEQIFNMPIDVFVEFEKGDTLFTVQNNQQAQHYELITKQAPINITLDPDHWIIRDTDAVSTPDIQIVSPLVFQQNGESITELQQGNSYEIQVNMSNTGIDADQVQVSLITEAQGINISTSSYTIESFQHNQEPESVEFEIVIAENAPSQLAEFHFSFISQAGSDVFTQSFTLQAKIGSPTLLFVDDDQGFNYEYFYRKMAVEANIYSDVHNSDSLGLPALDKLLAHQVVVWFTGNDRSTTLTSDEQQVVKSYLANHGRLLLTGQGIGEDLSSGSGEDQQFLTDILHCEILNPATDNSAIVGMPTDALGDGIMLRLDDIYEGANNQTAVSEIKALSPAVQFLMYLPIQAGAGLYFEDKTSMSKLLYLPFGMEGIEGPKQNSASTLLQTCYNWLSGNLTHVDEKNILPQEYTVSQNYPNPFNPSTSIAIDCPAAGHLSIEIFNMLGQTLYLTQLQADAGKNIFQWDGKNIHGVQVSAGLYFAKILYQTDNTNNNKTIKMIKLP